ncbi:hypothetical protein [Streptomyces omiyaensis]|uniref:hypothetical protein n=1 Tax=Streptomyces omiyaensis TaxID=68247 RepID=UPI0036FAC75E
MFEQAGPAHDGVTGLGPGTAPWPAGRVACVASGRAGELAARVEDPSFVARCAARYAAVGFGVPGEAEVRSWRNSWPPVLRALVRAGLSDVWVYLEYGTPGGGRRLDALVVGAAPGGALGLVVVELKQWQACRVLDTERVLRADGVVTTHPVFQVAAYRGFFEHWRPESAPELDVRAVVLLHNATVEEAAVLRAGAGAVADIPVLSGADLAAPAKDLAGLLRCQDLSAPDPTDVRAFEEIRWEPSARLLDHVGTVLEGHSAFALTSSCTVGGGTSSPGWSIMAGWWGTRLVQ